MLDEEVVEKVLGAAAAGGAMAELFVEDRKTSALRLDDSRVEDVSSGVDAGAGVRVISGDTTSYAYTNLLSAEALLETAQAARAGLGVGESPAAIDLRREDPAVRHPVEIDPEEVGAGDKAAALRAADEAARA
ncbi:MAG: TldD/PmbA family protein, partial [Actinobacteria bacterium]|nr:TldD/PmbA family protein [Actinomycetota bacterium]